MQPDLPATEPDGQQVVVWSIGFATDGASVVGIRGHRVLVQPLGHAAIAASASASGLDSLPSYSAWPYEASLSRMMYWGA